MLSPRLISYLILNYFPVLQVDLSLRLPLPLCSANPPLLFEKLKINPGEGHEGNQGQEGASSARIGLLHVIKRRLKICILLLYFLFSKQRNSLLEQEREQGRLPCLGKSSLFILEFSDAAVRAAYFKVNLLTLKNNLFPLPSVLTLPATRVVPWFLTKPVSATSRRSEISEHSRCRGDSS